MAQQAGSHKIGESLILPAAKDIISSILEATQLDIVSSNNLVTRRVKEIALDEKYMLIKNIKNRAYFSPQINVTTDITNMPNLIYYVRYQEDSKRAE